MKGRPNSGRESDGGGGGGGLRMRASHMVAPIGGLSKPLFESCCGQRVHLCTPGNPYRVRKSRTHMKVR